METPVESMETLWACNDNVFSLLTKIPHGVYVDSMKTSPVDSPCTGYFNNVNRI